METITTVIKHNQERLIKELVPVMTSPYVEILKDPCVEDCAFSVRQAYINRREELIHGGLIFYNSYMNRFELTKLGRRLLQAILGVQ